MATHGTFYFVGIDLKYKRGLVMCLVAIPHVWLAGFSVLLCQSKAGFDRSVAAYFVIIALLL